MCKFFGLGMARMYCITIRVNDDTSTFIKMSLLDIYGAAWKGWLKVGRYRQRTETEKQCAMRMKKGIMCEIDWMHDIS